MTQQEHFRFSPEILRRLGEELVPHIDQGIVELVRNAYDADAAECTVELRGTERAGGSIHIHDNGLGMDLDDIRSGWLLLGRSSKRNTQRTGGGRLPVGEKGLGRLAALRMGRKAELRTRPSGRHVEHRLEIDWQRFEDAEAVEAVALSVDSTPTRDQSGTDIDILDLGVVLRRAQVDRLARALLLLADPFNSEAGFRPRLLAPEFKDLEARVREGYLSDAEFRLVASLRDGVAKAEAFGRNGRRLWTTTLNARRPYRTANAQLEVWIFLLDGGRFTRSVSTTQIKAWLSVVGGIHVYHRNLRVQPYGDPGHDWLDMNLARAKSPELRPSTNTSIGRISLDDPEDQLSQKTDRTGFIENEAFVELRRFATDALDWLATERLKERDKQREAERKSAPKQVAVARESLDDAIKAVPAKIRPEVVRAVRRLERAHEAQARSLREDVQLYRTLGTVGTTTAVFAHETAKPATTIDKMSDLVANRGRALLGDTYEAKLAEPVSLIKQAAKTLKTFAALPIRLLQWEKRRVGPVEFNDAVRDACALFRPFLDDSKVELLTELVNAPTPIRGSVASVEAIVSNLLINALNALDRGAGRTRQILVRSELAGSQAVTLRVIDSGPGIQGISLDDIWLPGRTTASGGTGLGLTIVRDATLDLGGQVHAANRSELGGAEFLIELPLAES